MAASMPGLGVTLGAGLTDTTKRPGPIHNGGWMDHKYCVLVLGRLATSRSGRLGVQYKSAGSPAVEMVSCTAGPVINS